MKKIDLISINNKFVQVASDKEGSNPEFGFFLLRNTKSFKDELESIEENNKKLRDSVCFKIIKSKEKELRETYFHLKYDGSIALDKNGLPIPKDPKQSLSDIDNIFDIELKQLKEQFDAARKVDEDIEKFLKTEVSEIPKITKISIRKIPSKHLSDVEFMDILFEYEFLLEDLETAYNYISTLE